MTWPDLGLRRFPVLCSKVPARPAAQSWICPENKSISLGRFQCKEKAPSYFWKINPKGNIGDFTAANAICPDRH